MGAYSGWFSIHRKLLDEDLWLSEEFTKGQAWVDLIGLANHKKGFIYKRGIQIEVNRGQCGYGKETLQKRWGWSKGKLTRFLKNLEIRECITILQNDNVTTLLSINNYEIYQSNGRADELANDSASDSANDSALREGKRVPNNKTNKENKFNKGKDDYSDDFLTWWSAYPNYRSRKCKRKQCYQKWKALKRAGELPDLEELLDALDRHRRKGDWTKDDGAYWPGPFPYLNGQQWETVMEEAPAGQPGSGAGPSKFDSV